jgi:hypothetical protein
MRDEPPGTAHPSSPTIWPERDEKYAAQDGSSLIAGWLTGGAKLIGFDSRFLFVNN